MNGSRGAFIAGVASALTACSAASHDVLAGLSSGNRHTARWIQVSPADAVVQIGVSGYSPADALAGRVPNSFRQADHPELPPHAPSVKHVDTYINCVPPSGWCPSPLWFMAQTGTTPITMNGNGQYILPDGSVWINTDAVYAGANQTGPLEGFIYYGSNGSQWFAGASHASTPESMSQYQQNMDQLTAQVTKISCGGSGG